MIKKIFAFIMFILPFTQSKVRDAQVLLSSVDQALDLLQKQQNSAVGRTNEMINDLMANKGISLTEIEKATKLRELINGLNQ